MADIISFRFKPHELKHINKLSTLKNIDRTTAARKLIEYGWLHYILMQYKEGKLSLGQTAKELHIPITDLIDLLANAGIKSPISYEDFLEGLKNV